MRIYAWLLLIGWLSIYGCGAPEIDGVLLETQLQGSQKAISDAAELDAEQLAADDYARAVKLLKFAKQAHEQGNIAQSAEFAYQAELVAQIALYKAKQQQTHTQLIAVREQMYQEMITEKEYELEIAQIRSEMDARKHAQTLKTVAQGEERATALTTEVAELNDKLRHAEIRIPIAGAEILVAIARQIDPAITETAEYERVQATITLANSHLTQKAFADAEKVATDAKTQADSLYEQAIKNHGIRLEAATVARIAIALATLKVARADSLNAATHAPEQFLKAQNQLNTAKKALEANQYKQAQQTAEAAAQTVDAVIITAEAAEYRNRAQRELETLVKQATEALETAKAAIAAQAESKVPQLSPELYGLATSALTTAETALTRKEYTVVIEAAQQSQDYLQRAVQNTQQHGSAQTALVQATKQIPKAVVIELEEGVLIRISGSLFATTSTRLKTEFSPTFTKLAEILQQNAFKNYTTKIECHSTPLGEAEVNRRLSQSRAEAVKTFLVQKGRISEKRLTAIGLGESQPIDTNSPEKNRRIDIIISK